MKRRFALAAVLTLLTLGTIADAGQDRAGSNAQEQGMAVMNWKGEYIGTSNHVVLHSLTGTVVLIIVSLNWEEPKEIAVPTGLFSVDRKKGVLVLSISKNELDSAPDFHASDLEDPEFVKKVYYFYATGSPQAEETPSSNI